MTTQITSIVFALALCASAVQSLSQNAVEIHTAPNSMTSLLAAIEDEQSEAAVKLESELQKLVAEERHNEILSLLSETTERSPGRGVLYHSIINAKRYTATDIPFLTRVFIFAANESKPVLSPYREPKRPLAGKRALASLGTRLLPAMGQEVSIPDPEQQIFNEDPKEWLASKLRFAFKHATDEKAISSINAALGQIQRSQPANINAAPNAESKEIWPQLLTTPLPTPTSEVSPFATIPTTETPK